MALTVEELLTEIRGDLDERGAEGVWRNADLITWINAGIVKVSAKLKRVTREDWLTKYLHSDDSAITIGLETYNPGNIQITAGVSTYTLPPDLVEIRQWEPKPQAFKDNGYRLIGRDMSNAQFVALSREESTITRRAFLYDLYGLNSVRVVPTPAETFHTTMWYSVAPTRLRASDTISIIPVWAYEAVKLYVRYRAFKSVSHPDTAGEIALFNEELSTLGHMATPRQSQDPVIVEGVFDEDDFYIGLDVVTE